LTLSTTLSPRKMSRTVPAHYTRVPGRSSGLAPWWRDL
jgi:hypothetical protein